MIDEKNFNLFLQQFGEIKKHKGEYYIILKNGNKLKGQAYKTYILTKQKVFQKLMNDGK